jgi:protein arginine kinase activator
VRQCSQCGFLEAQLAGSTHLGCAHCYTVFYDQLSPLIWNFQGSTVHHGEVPPQLWRKDQARAQVYREAIDRAKSEGRIDDADILMDLLRFLEER